MDGWMDEQFMFDFVIVMIIESDDSNTATPSPPQLFPLPPPFPPKHPNHTNPLPPSLPPLQACNHRSRLPLVNAPSPETLRRKRPPIRQTPNAT